MSSRPNPISMPLIIPASGETRREAGVVWYELAELDGPGSLHITGFDQDAKPISSMKLQLAGALRASVALTEGKSTLRLSLVFVKDYSGSENVSVTFDQTAVKDRTENQPEQGHVSRHPSISDEQRALLVRWSTLSNPLHNLGEALVSNSVLRAWGCTSCMVLLGGIAAGTFVAVSEANPAVGVGVVVAGASFIANCEGACA